MEFNQQALKDNPELRETLILGYMDTYAYVRWLYPERYYHYTEAHAHAFEAIDARTEEGKIKYKRICLVAPRGFGKTSMANGVVDKKIRYNDCHYCMYIGKNAGFAMKQTESIKRAINQNKLGRKIFGNIKAVSSQATEDASMFNKEAWITSNGIMVLPRGWRQPIRGENFVWHGKTYRPDLVIFDDVEDPEEILNEEIRFQMRQKFFSDMNLCVSQDEDAEYQLIYIDTLKHNDSLIEHLRLDPEWLVIDIPVCDKDYNTLIPEIYSQERLNKMVASYRAQGRLDIFYREYMGIASSQEEVSFKKDYFKYYNETDEEFQNILMHPSSYTFVIGDPAKKVGMISADSAIPVVTVNLEHKRIFFRGGLSDKLHPDEFYDWIFKLYFKYDAHVIGIEKTGLEEYITFPVHSKARELGVPLKNIYWLTARKAADYGREGGKGKVARIGQLASFYKQGYIYHNAGHPLTEKLEGQLLDFPRARLVDVSDAFAYVLELLETVELYFENPIDLLETEADIEREYNNLYADEERIPIEYEGVW